MMMGGGGLVRIVDVELGLVARAKYVLAYVDRIVDALDGVVCARAQRAAVEVDVAVEIEQRVAQRHAQARAIDERAAR